MASRARVAAVDAPAGTIVPATLQPVPASLFEFEPQMNQLGPAGVLSSLVNARGLRLACYYWPVSLIKAPKWCPPQAQPTLSSF